MGPNFMAKLYKKFTNRYIRSYLATAICKREGGQAYSHTLRELYREIYRIDVGYGSYGGCFNQGYIRPNVKFGNYCSIATEVKVFRANHPVDWFTTHPITYDKNMGARETTLEYKPIEIGHGVWIGSGAIILPSVNHIGNGAIIGAGSIVTKDVPPYGIAAGNPAKLIRKRFSEDIIKKLEETEWWLLPKEKLVDEFDRLNNIARGED